MLCHSLTGYHNFWEEGLGTTQPAIDFARQYKKPVFNSETGCIARANAFDQTMELAAKSGIGFAIWELMISACVDCIDTRRWKHGLFYGDGTTRDPLAIAAVRGTYINRRPLSEPDPALRPAVPRPDVEGLASSAIKAAAALLNSPRPFIDGLDLLDELGNMAEAAGTVPDVRPVIGAAHDMAAAGESEEVRERLATLIAAQAAELSKTKDGKEADVGSCTF